MASDYKEQLQRLMKLESSEIVSNGKPDHAAAIFEVFLENAKDSVLFFCRNLAKNVFGQQGVQDALLAAIGRGVRISIICQEEPECSELAGELTALANTSKKVSFRVCSEADVQIKATKVNFAVMDNKAFRVEPDSAKLEGYACMNNAATSAKLAGFFVNSQSKMAA